MDPIEFLKQHEPFSRLSEKGLGRLQQNLDINYVPAGTTVLAREGPPNTCVWVVRKGSVTLQADGRPVDELAEGETFGFPSLLNEGLPQLDVVTTDDCLLYRIDGSTFRALLEEPPFGQFFLEGLAGRLRSATAGEPLPLAGDLATPVERLILRQPVCVEPTRTVGEAARVMRDLGIGSVLVTSEPMGILTDRDLRSRVLAEGKGPETPVVDVMSSPLMSVAADAPLLEALLWLLDRRVHHLPLDRDGQIVGVVTHTDLLRHHSKSPAFLLKRIDRIGDATTLADHAKEIAGMVESLLWGGLGPVDIGQIVAAVNDALIHRLLRDAEAELGSPPCAYAWMVHGSEGRREQALITDQDNALVYADDTPEAKAYFGKLSEWMVKGLISASFPPCEGGYMATKWHLPLEEWQRLFERWTSVPDPQALMEAANFFDFRAIYGQLDLEPLHQLIVEGAQKHIFLAHLARAGLEMRPPLGLFKRIKQDKEGVDLKAGGLIPIVSLARVYGLGAGTRRRSTLKRLEAAQEAGLLSDRGAETLAEGFRFLFRLRLKAQLDARRRGRRAHNRVKMEALSDLEKHHLKETFLSIREMQEATSTRFSVGRLG